MELTEVKQSKSNENIEHIEPAELKNKKQVYSQAHFVRQIGRGRDRYGVGWRADPASLLAAG